jgi:hypothetical protein
MAAYTVAGHPLNIHDTGIANAETLRALLQINGVGASVNIALAGADDTKAKGQGALK